MPTKTPHHSEPGSPARELQQRRWASLGRLLGFASGIFNHRVIEEVRRRGHPGIRPPHSAMTRSMDLDGTRITTLAERAGVTKQAMGKVVRAMEEMGYVRITSDPADGRAKLVSYTRRGSRLATDIVEAAETIEREYESALGRKRMRELRALLQDLVPRIVPTDVADEQGWRT